MSWLVAATTATGVLALACPWFLARSTKPTPLPAAPIAASASPVAAAPAPAATGSLAPTAGPTPVVSAGSRELLLPDGTTVPTLNDAVDAAPIGTYWGQSPWSPIVGIERSSAGVDWYRHADGSYSTTQMVWRRDLGRHVAMTRVAHPGPAAAPVATPH